RYHGATLAGLVRVPCIVRAAAGPKAIEIMLIENCQRSDLGPVEKAEALGKLRRRGMTQADIARAIGLSQATVSYFLSLLDLDEPSRNRVRNGAVSVGDAIAAVRSTRRNTGGKRTGRPKVTVQADHFSMKHPLADAARLRCQLAGHSGQFAVMYGRDNAGAGGKVACGECWEHVIRADERGENLPVDRPAPSAREERARVVASLRMLPANAGGTADPGAGFTTARQAAQMLGVTPRTIERYKASMAAAP
ncbi:MAG TPA: hypothetical protein VN714_02645, partial [Trebonia sp.]|nr:hypothetical protein [Trebonia sp.]